MVQNGLHPEASLPAVGTTFQIPGRDNSLDTAGGAPAGVNAAHPFWYMFVLTMLDGEYEKRLTEDMQKGFPGTGAFFLSRYQRRSHRRR